MNPAAKLRKAAILVASLDGPTADRILDQMSDEQAGQVRRMMVELGDVDPREQREVIDEFFQHGPARQEPRPAKAAKEAGGVELAGALARLAQDDGDPAAWNEAEPLADPAPNDPTSFRFLREAHSARISPFLSGEHPQTIALVVSQLPPQRAAGVLAALDGRLQADVLRRLADLDETDPEIVREVERGLESKIIAQVRSERRRAAGLNAVAGILEAAEPAAKRAILSNLARHDRPLAGKLRPEAFEFADLLRLDDRALAVIFAAAETELTCLALADASPALVARLLEPLSPAERKQFAHSIKNLGPMRLSDVEEAQQQIAELARQLALEGEIELPDPDPAPMISNRQVANAYRH